MPRITRSKAKPTDHGVAGGGSGAAKLIGPIAAMGATWGVRKALDSGYRRRTGQEPPRSTDPETSLGKVLAWAAVSAVAIAVIQVVIDRLTSGLGD